MVYKSLLFISLLLLSGCATHDEFKRDMNNWVGSDIKTYTKHNGKPLKTSKNVDGNTIYAYSYSSVENETQQRCDWWVEVTKSQKVKKITWDGNYCVAYPSAFK